MPNDTLPNIAMERISALEEKVHSLEKEVYVLRAALLKQVTMTVTALTVDNPVATPEKRNEAFNKMGRLLKHIHSVTENERAIGELPSTIDTWNDD